MGGSNFTGEHLPTQGFFIIIVVLDSLCVFFGILGNVGVIIYNVFMNHAKTPTTYFVVNLAIADFLVCVTLFPTWMIEFIDIALGRESFDQTLMCRVIFTSSAVSVALSMSNLLAITLDRYIFISRPLKYLMIATWPRTYFVLIVTWLSSTTIAILVVFHTERSAHRLYCEMDLSINLMFSVLYFYIPITAMLFLNYKMFKIAGEQRRKIRTENTANVSSRTSTSIQSTSDSNVPLRPSRIRQQLKVMKTFAIVLGVFLFCIGPFAAVSAIETFVVCDNFCVPTSVYIFTGFLASANSAFNPFIYGIRHKEYWMAYRQLFSNFFARL